MRATFFPIGSRVDEDADVAKRSRKKGIQSKPLLLPSQTLAASPLLAQRLFRERTKEALARLGIKRQRVFPPTLRGPLNLHSIEQAADLGYRVAMWSIDSLDWRGLSRTEVIRNIQGYVGAGISDSALGRRSR